MSKQPSRGDIYWASLARPDAPSSGDLEATSVLAHPHVIVQDDLFNHSRIDTIVVCALTTNPNRASEPGNVPLDPGEANLPRPSVVVVSQISSIAKADLGDYIGSLSEARIEQILDGLRLLQRSFFTR
jgi:mRNA interferase MazF